jgi:phenylalanyl-tRNA synthetase beta chain
MRPISAAVDATNYAMLEVGQPLHPFDLALLKGPGIVVRRAEEGERMTTLDDVERTFTSDDLLICDAERAVGVAGVMGGSVSEISPSTTDVLLEAASFRREGIQRTRRRLELSTEASMRFERGVDPEAAPVGADRACRLMSEWCGATVLRGALEVGGAPPRRRIDVRASRASSLIGYPVSRADAALVFDRLAMRHQPAHDDALSVEIPGYRVDLEREVDLIEEIVRIQGYDRVGSTLPPVRQTGGLPPRYALLERVRRAMVRAGLREVKLIPFVSDEDLELVPGPAPIRVTNPLLAEEAWLRNRLLPGLLKAARRNAARHVRSTAIFEASTVFALEGGEPGERPAVGFVMTGETGGWSDARRESDVFDAKGVVEELLAELGVAWAIGPPPGPPFHPGRSASLAAGDDALGVFGELHPKIAARLDLRGRVAVGELDVDAIGRHVAEVGEVRAVPRFPPVRRDLAFLLERSAPAGAVQSALEDAAGDLLDSCVLFDVHEGPPLPEGTKSLGFSVDLRAADRTLTDAEANDAVARIVERLAREFDARLRAG